MGGVGTASRTQDSGTGRNEQLASGETFGLKRLLTISITKHISRWPSIPRSVTSIYVPGGATTVTYWDFLPLHHVACTC
jgi:hypothetical protein